MGAWLRWCCCGDCLRGRARHAAAADAKALLTAASADDLSRKEACYYAYRHIPSLRRDESKEALGGSGDEGDGADAVSGDPRGGGDGPAPPTAPTAPAPPAPRPCARAASPAPSCAGGAADAPRSRDGSTSAGGGGRRAPWHGALDVLKPKRRDRLSPHRRLPPELALSTPDLAQLSPPAGAPRSAHTLRAPALRILGASSVCLRAALRSDASDTAPDEGRASLGSHSARWSRSRSMESVDLNIEPSTPPADEVFHSEEGSQSLARSVGLNMSLYSAYHPAPVGATTTSTTSKSLLWSPLKPEQKNEFGRENIEEYKEISKSDNTVTLSTISQPLSTEDFVDHALGSITFTASYFQKNKKLSIEVNKLEKLPPKGRNNTYDVMVRLCLLPADKQVKTSKILRGSLSPMVQEDFTFSIKEPVGKVVRFSVFNALLQGKYDAIGHALFNVEDVMNGRSRRYSMKLSHQSQLEPSFGSLLVYLQLTQEQRLIVDTIQARNLSVSHALKSNRSTDKFSTYVKITFYCSGQKVKSKKSAVVTGDRNPRYEYSCDFKIVPNYMEDCYIVLSIVLKVNLRKDITLGRYILGPHFFSENQDLTPWGQVVLKHQEVHHWFHLYL